MEIGRPFSVVVIAGFNGDVEVIATWSVGDHGFKVNTWS
jgi:hypothetical protein